MAKRKIRVPKVVDGRETMVEMEVDDSTLAHWPERASMKLLGHPMPRLDGPDKVTGRARYTHDVRLPGMLYGRALISPHPRARVVALDTGAAAAMPGVKAVISFANKELRYQGDPVAAVAAEKPEQAEDAIRAIKVRYEKLPHVADEAAARAAGAPEVHEGGNVQQRDSKGEAGPVAAAMAACAATVEGEFRTPQQHHCCFETHGVVVDYRGGQEATVYTSTQATFSVPHEAADKLALPRSQVKAVVHHMGGGFGSKFGLDLPGSLACALSKKSGRPVHFMLTRNDEFLMAGNRSASLQKLKLGADRSGKLLALEAEQYAIGGLGQGDLRGQPLIYHVDQLHRQLSTVYLNVDASRAFRAPGTPQASFAFESLLDDLAARLDMDPLELRRLNCPKAYHHQMERGAREIGWERRNRRPGGGTGTKKRGMGMALSAWGGGGSPACQVNLQIHPDGKVDVSVGTQDLGTGTRTYTAAIVAEVLTVPLSAVTPHIGDSTLGNASGSGGSTTTASLAPAVKDAADNARTALLARLAPVLKSNPEELDLRDGRVLARNGQSLSWAQACAALGTRGVSADGVWKLGLNDNGTQGVQFAEVEVDMETGRVRVLKLVAVQNCGLALNPLAVQSQLNGGMIQGLGYALLEGRVTDRNSGLMLNASLEEYKIPGLLEIPKMVALIDDTDTRGVIGVAEPAIIPTAGAIANAVFNACGVRVRSLPITPEKILA